MRWIFLVSIILVSTYGFSQVKRAKLRVETGFCKLNYYEVDSLEKLDDEIDSIIGSKSCEAFGDFTKARTIYYVQRTSVGLGLTAVVFPFLLYAVTQDEEMLQSIWPVSVCGLGVTLATIPFTGKMKKRAKNSVDVYNDFIGLSGYKNTSPKLKLGYSQSGVGMSVSF